VSSDREERRKGVSGEEPIMAKNAQRRSVESPTVLPRSNAFPHWELANSGKTDSTSSDGEEALL